MSKDYTLKEALTESSKSLYKAMDEARNSASTSIEVAAADNACWNAQQLIESNDTKKQTKEHSLAQRKSMKRQRVWHDTNEKAKFVCDGAKVTCPFNSALVGTLKVTSTSIKLQDKPWATVEDKNNAQNLLFKGVCNHPRWGSHKPPCKNVMNLTQWENVSQTVIGVRHALLVRSSIPCTVSNHNIKIVHSGQTTTVASNVAPEVIDYWWSYSSKINGKRITTAWLEETVYFHVKTKGVSNKLLALQLWDKDLFFDDEMDYPKMKKSDSGKGKIRIIDNHGVTKMRLPIEWTQSVLADNPRHYRSLYIQIVTELGCDMLFCDMKLDKHLLDIRISKRDLYVEPSLSSKWSGIKVHIPEIYDTEGHNLSIIPVYGYDEDKAIKLFGETIIGIIEDRVREIISKCTDNKVRAYALTKLKEGYLRGNNGKLYTPITTRSTQRKVYRHIIYTNSGEAVEVTSGKTLSVTKGIDQIKGVERIGVEGKVLGILQKGCNLWTLYGQMSPFVDLFTWAAENNHSKPIPLPIIGGISELMMQNVAELEAEIDSVVYRNLKRQLNDVKRKGLTEVRGLVLSRIFRDRASRINLEYILYPISHNQFQEIMEGNILYYDSLDYTIDGGYTILIRRQTDNNRDMRINIVETIFKE